MKIFVICILFDWQKSIRSKRSNLDSNRIRHNDQSCLAEYIWRERDEENCTFWVLTTQTLFASLSHVRTETISFFRPTSKVCPSWALFIYDLLRCLLVCVYISVAWLTQFLLNNLFLFVECDVFVFVCVARNCHVRVIWFWFSQCVHLFWNFCF